MRKLSRAKAKVWGLCLEEGRFTCPDRFVCWWSIESLLSSDLYRHDGLEDRRSGDCGVNEGYAYCFVGEDKHLPFEILEDESEIHFYIHMYVTAIPKFVFWMGKGNLSGLY